VHIFFITLAFTTETLLLHPTLTDLPGLGIEYQGSVVRAVAWGGPPQFFAPKNMHTKYENINSSPRALKQ